MESAITADNVCSELLLRAWYLDDSVVTGPCTVGSRKRILNWATHWAFFSTNELFGPIEMKKSNVPHLEIIGAPIGDPRILC